MTSVRVDVPHRMLSHAPQENAGALECAAAVPVIASLLHVSGKEDELIDQRKQRQKHRVLFSLELLSVRDPMHAIFNVLKCVINLMLIIAYHMSREVYNRLIRVRPATLPWNRSFCPCLVL